MAGSGSSVLSSGSRGPSYPVPFSMSGKTSLRKRNYEPSLGTINTDDTEVLRADPSDTGTDHATSLVDGLRSGRGVFLGLGSAAHGKDLLERVWGEDQLPRRKSAWL